MKMLQSTYRVSVANKHSTFWCREIIYLLVWELSMLLLASTHVLDCVADHLHLLASVIQFQCHGPEKVVLFSSAKITKEEIRKNTFFLKATQQS